MKLNEEQQKLVTLAALAGVRFRKIGGYWKHSVGIGSGWCTICRAASDALHGLELRTIEEHREYLGKTEHYMLRSDNEVEYEEAAQEN